VGGVLGFVGNSENLGKGVTPYFPFRFLAQAGAPSLLRGMAALKVDKPKQEKKNRCSNSSARLLQVRFVSTY
jgi:hypothetical protein